MASEDVGKGSGVGRYLRPQLKAARPNPALNAEPFFITAVIFPGQVDAQRLEIHRSRELRSLIGRGGGETFQMLFQGDGFVVVQPFEEVPVPTQQGG